MKTITLLTTAVSLLQLTSAQPHRRRQHGHQHEKKDTVVVVTDYVYSNEVVYVDENGNPISTGTTDAAPSTSSSTSFATASASSSSIVPEVYASPSSSVVTTSSTSIYVEPTPTSVVVEPTPEPTYAPSSSSATSAAATPAASAPVAAGGDGFVYTPYKSDGNCKTQDDVTKDFEGLQGDYSLVRFYGTDCNQVSTILTAAKAKGLKIFAGVYNIANLNSELQIIIDAANQAGGWGSFHTISIGNELVNSGQASASQVVAAVSSARSTLKAAGYTGFVVTVDTLVATRQHPELCNESDYCAVNCHPFFDSQTASAQAGSFITTQVGTLRDVLSNPDQEIVITETGWPWKGDSHGAASVSLDDQTKALSSIKSDVSVTTILLSAYNEGWKVSSPSQFNAEQFWGLGGTNAPCES
ncbi:cell wall glucanase [Phlyctema vagabunda]|uniref:Cell wall glucanase n=1 Tax=Phlyctema vagabunda TaxID=108571 RepID=A0ABR4PSI3_9HELO